MRLVHRPYRLPRLPELDDIRPAFLLSGSDDPEKDL